MEIMEIDSEQSIESLEIKEETAKVYFYRPVNHTKGTLTKFLTEIKKFKSDIYEEALYQCLNLLHNYAYNENLPFEKKVRKSRKPIKKPSEEEYLKSADIIELNDSINTPEEVLEVVKEILEESEKSEKSEELEAPEINQPETTSQNRKKHILDMLSKL